jgi:hypothetical protein
MNKFLSLSLVALIVSCSLSLGAEQKAAVWTKCESPMTDIVWGKVMLIHTHITTSGDGQTIYVHSIIDRSQPSMNGMLGRFFFKSQDGGTTWSYLRPIK